MWISDPTFDQNIRDKDDADIHKAVSDEHRTQQRLRLLKQINNAPVSGLPFCFEYFDILESE
jgi:hypothetical protein